MKLIDKIGWALWVVLLFAFMYLFMVLFGTGASFTGLIFLIIVGAVIEYFNPFRKSKLWVLMHL
jgi:hypothetical protein